MKERQASAVPNRDRFGKCFSDSAVPGEWANGFIVFIEFIVLLSS
jgi:hypothetical protein